MNPNLKHYILGLFCLYAIALKCDFYELPIVDKWAAGIIWALFIGTIIGSAWELFELWYVDAKVDKFDIMRTAAGGVLGLLASYLIQSETLFWAVIVVGAAMVVYEVYGYWKRKRQANN